MKKLILCLFLMPIYLAPAAASKEKPVQSLDEDESHAPTRARTSEQKHNAEEKKQEERGLDDKGDADLITLIIEPDPSKKGVQSGQKITLPQRLINYSTMLKTTFSFKSAFTHTDEKQIIFKHDDLKSITLQDLEHVLKIVDRYKYNKPALKKEITDYFNTLSIEQFLDWLYVQDYLDIGYISHIVLQAARLRIFDLYTNKAEFDRFLNVSLNRFVHLPPKILDNILSWLVCNSPVLTLLSRFKISTWQLNPQELPPGKAIAVSDNFFARFAPGAKLIEIFNCKNLQQVQVIDLQDSPDRAKSIITPNGYIFIAYGRSGMDYILKIYDIKTGKLRKSIEFPIAFTMSVMPHENYVALLFEHYGVQILNTHDFSVVQEFVPPVDQAAANSPQSNSGVIDFRRPIVNNQIQQATISSHATNMAVLMQNNQIYIKNIKNNTLTTLNAGINITAINFALNDNQLLVAQDNKLTLWDIKSQKAIIPYQDLREGVKIIDSAVLPQLQIIIARTDPYGLALYNLTHGSLIYRLNLTVHDYAQFNSQNSLIIADRHLLDFNPLYDSIKQAVKNLTPTQTIYLLYWLTVRFPINKQTVHVLESFDPELQKFIKSRMSEQTVNQLYPTTLLQSVKSWWKKGS